MKIVLSNPVGRLRANKFFRCPAKMPKTKPTRVEKSDCFCAKLDDLFNRMSMIQNRRRTVLTVANPCFRIDADGFVDGGSQIGRRMAAGDWVGGLFVAGTDDLTHRRSTTREED